MKFDVKLLTFLLIATAMVFIFGAKSVPNKNPDSGIFLYRKFLTKRHPNFSHQRINENFNCSQEACDRTLKAMIKESIRNLTIEKVWHGSTFIYAVNYITKKNCACINQLNFARLNHLSIRPFFRIILLFFRRTSTSNSFFLCPL
jgi:hypothetical protein